MQTPLRLLLLLRPSVAPGILSAVGFSTVVLAATPFLLPAIAAHYDRGLGAASLVSVAQLGGFVVGSWGAGRVLAPRRRVFVATLVVAVVTNLVSATLPVFAVLVALRLVSGLALGLIAWFSWAQVFGDDARMSDVAVIGPAVGIVAAPVLSAVTDRGGAEGLFLLLGLLAIAPLALNRGTGTDAPRPARRRRTRPVPAARVLLLSLGLFTLGGSAVFQFAVVIGTRELDLSTTTIAVAFSLNGVASVPSAGWRRRRGIPSLWMASTAVAAAIVASAPSPTLFVGALVWWGFAYWMGVPGVFSVLAAKSRHPAERAGDAQAVMAAGRVGGPLLGGVLLEEVGNAALAAVGGITMVAAAAAVLLVRTTAPDGHEHDAVR